MSDSSVSTSSASNSTRRSRLSVGKLLAFGGLLAVMSAAFLVPGLTRGSQKVGTVDSLRTRVTAFWEARLQKDHAAIYDIYEPRLHEVATPAEFLRSRGLIDYFVYSVEDVRVDGDKGSSRVRYTWKPNHPSFSKLKPKDDVMEDQWMFADGEWRKLYEGFQMNQPLPAGADPSSVRAIEKGDATNPE
jgi:hypothetical protein